MPIALAAEIGADAQPQPLRRDDGDVFGVASHDAAGQGEQPAAKAKTAGVRVSVQFVGHSRQISAVAAANDLIAATT